MGVAEVISGWLGAGELVITDGGMGSQLQAEGAAMDGLAFPELGDGDSFEDLLSDLVSPPPAAVTVMHADPELTLDAIEVIRGHFAGPVGVYAETGSWEPPIWIFDGMTPAEYLREAVSWAEHGAQLIGGCCGVGPGHIARPSPPGHRAGPGPP